MVNFLHISSNNAKSQTHAIYTDFCTGLIGEHLDGKLTIERFLQFQEQLQREILTLEFSRKPAIDSTGHRISERDFADLLLTYADYTSKKRSAVFKRVKKKYSSKSENPGVTLEDYIQIFSVLIHIDDVDKVSST